MIATGGALITGASRGIGRALALELARRGFDVTASMRNPAASADLAAEAQRANLQVRIAQIDVDAPPTIVIPDNLRVLVNNAAIEEDYLPVEETPIDQWRRVFDTNVFGLIEVTRRAIPVLRRNGGGVICNLTSSSLLAPMPFYAVYRASKAAVSAIGESLRVELAPFGIRVIEVLPGPIETDMLAHSDRTYEAAAYPAYRDMAERSLANRRGVAAGTPATDAAHAIADAIVAGDGPLRIACDPMSAQMLDMWRQASDEQWMRSMMSMLWGIE
jgi:NAD(P)-dependent dehydrogenase (short-subunit alcohol dehydrogenase family)